MAIAVTVLSGIIITMLGGIGAMMLWILTGIRDDLKMYNLDREKLWNIVNDHLIDCAARHGST